MKIESGPNTQHDGRDAIQMVGNPMFLLRASDPDKKNARPRRHELLGISRVFFWRQGPKWWSNTTDNLDAREAILQNLHEIRQACFRPTIEGDRDTLFGGSSTYV